MQSFACLRDVLLRCSHAAALVSAIVITEGLHECENILFVTKLNKRKVQRRASS